MSVSKNYSRWFKKTYPKKIEIVEGLGVGVGTTQAHDDNAY